MRKALDREGGARIGIDYALIPTYKHLRDEAVRGAFISGLQDLPFDFLWVRTSGFGADASPLGTRHFITALSGFHNLGKPLIADYVGGLVGMSAIAFGAASGIAHGIGLHERFNAGHWDKPRNKNKEGRSGGSQIRIMISGLDKTVTIDELRMLAAARGGHRLVVCGDRNCCPHGIDDMIKNWRSHFLFQRLDRTHALEQIPDRNRTRHFLETDLGQADRLARQVKELKIGDEKMTKRLIRHSHRIEKKRSVLENLYDVRGDGAARAPAAVRRGVENADDNRGEV